MVIVDSTVWIDYLRGVKTPQTEWLENAIDNQRIGLTDLILCEVLQGVSNEKQFEEVRQTLLKCEVFDTGGTELAIQSAKNYQALRRQGKTIRKTIDCLIATFCILNNHALLHNDQDYDPFEESLGLDVIHP